MNNLKQIAVTLYMYLDDQPNGSPGNTNRAAAPFVSWTDYRALITPYVGIKGAPSPNDRIFACPADNFFYDTSGSRRGYVPEALHSQSNSAFTSYAYNAGQFTTPAVAAVGTNAAMPATTNFYGIAGRRLDTLPHPALTVMIGEASAYSPYSWHEPRKPFGIENSKFNDSRNMLAFADGHVAWMKMFFSGEKIAWSHNPPANYNYQWTGD
jgi:prepilin-type processing-associated H-X9-DG protein